LLAREHEPPAEEDYLVYNYNRFQACRFGLDGTIVHPQTYESLPLRDDIRATLTSLQRTASGEGTAGALEHILQSTVDGTDASFLRHEHALRGSCEGMVDAAIGRFRG
jgi:carboxylate-amine ligase